MSQLGKSAETESGLVVAYGWRGGRQRNGSQDVVLGVDEKVLKLDRADGCTTLRQSEPKEASSLWAECMAH